MAGEEDNDIIFGMHGANIRRRIVVEKKEESRAGNFIAELPQGRTRRLPGDRLAIAHKDSPLIVVDLSWPDTLWQLAQGNLDMYRDEYRNECVALLCGIEGRGGTMNEAIRKLAASLNAPMNEDRDW